MTETETAAAPEPHKNSHGHGKHHKKKRHKAKVEHSVPGRIRMKIPTAVEDPAVLEHYQHLFAKLPGVSDIKINPLTGSVVVHYDARRQAEFEQHFDTCCEDHAHHAVEHNGCRPGDEIGETWQQIEAEAEFLAGHSQLAKTAVDFCKGLDNQIKLATDNNIDLKIVIAAGLTAYTFLEIGAHAATPMWVTLGIFSLNHFAELQVANHRQPAAAPLPAL